MPFRNRISIVFTAVAAAAIVLVGCGRMDPTVHVDDAVEATEQALTEILLGDRDYDATSLTPAERPLLTKSGYTTVYIATDEKGFVALSRGAFTTEAVHEIQERVVKTISSNVRRLDFTAQGTTFPLPPEVAAAPHALLATITATTQDGGSPQDQASHKMRTLILVRLVVADAATGKILRERDYYSGNDAKPLKDASQFVQVR